MIVQAVQTSLEMYSVGEQEGGAQQQQQHYQQHYQPPQPAFTYDSSPGPPDAAAAMEFQVSQAVTRVGVT